MTAPHHHANACLAPKALRRCALLAAAAVLATTVDAQAPRERQPDLSTVGPLVIEQTNAFRGKHGIEPVGTHARLAEAAQRYADFIAGTDRYSHDADGLGPAERAQAAGYEYCVVAENLAYVFSSTGFTTEALTLRLMDGWARSPEHRKNMLLAAATDVGVGVAQSQRTQRYYAVQLFGRPKSAATQFQVANHADTAITYDIDGEMFNLPVQVTRTHTRCTDGTLRLVAPDLVDKEALNPRNGKRYIARRDHAGQVRLRAE
jgi:uncharacterized protein YkwD